MNAILRYNQYGVDNLPLEDWLKMNEEAGDLDQKTWSELVNKTVDDFNLNLSFLPTFGAGITAFFPIIETLVTKLNLSEVEINKETIVYLGICALAIMVKEAKQNYKPMFEELRLRGVYDVLKKLVDGLGFTHKLFNTIGRYIGKVAIGFVDLFGYTALLVPFLHAVNATISSMNIGLDAFNQLSIGDAISFVGGIGVFGVRSEEHV